MLNNKRGWIVCLALSVLSIISYSSTAQNLDIPTLQQKVEQYYPQTPDSALVYLKALAQKLPQTADSLRADAYSKIGRNYGQLENRDSSYTYFKKAIQASGQHPILTGKIYRLWGKVYRDFGAYKEGEHVLNIADSIFKTHWYPPGIGMVLVERATINHYTQHIKTAISQLKDAIRILKNAQDEEHLLIAKMELAASFLMSDQYEFAKDLYAEILPKLKEEKSLNYYFTLVNYADCFYELKTYDEALKRYKIAYNYFKKERFKKYEYYVLSKIAESHFALHHYSTALEQFRTSFQALDQINSPRLQQVASSYLRILNYRKEKTEALHVVQTVIEKSKSHKTKLNINNDLAFLKEAINTYKQNGDFKKGLALSERFIFLSDSLSSTEDEALAKKLEAKYQNKYHRENNRLLKSRNNLLLKKSNNRKWIIGLLGTILILLIFLGIILCTKGKEKAKHQEEKVRGLLRKKQITEQKRVLQLKLDQERKELLATKNRELTALSMQLADGAKELKSILKKSSPKDLSPQVRSKLKQLINKKNYWTLFNKRFTEIHPKFTQSIEKNFPQFTQADIEFCKLLKLHLENKEIATLLGISHQSVITKKYRLRKKLRSQEEETHLDQLLK